MGGDRTIELPGSWSHRYVAANGARFHIAETPTEKRASRVVLLLHGFPEFWWAWRHQLPALADAGYHAVAMDLRGYGASDKTPRGYDPMTLSADVSGVIRALGVQSAVVVGHGWGGLVGWATAAGHADVVAGFCAVAAPHPFALTRSPASWLSTKAVSHVLAMQLPWIPERRIARGSYVADHLSAWSGPRTGFPSAEEASRYRSALALWPSPHCALEYHRWLFRSRLRADGRAFARMMRRSVGVPVAHIGGAEDPAEPPGAVTGSARHVTASFAHYAVGNTGHFPHEERPDEFNRLLLSWLAASGLDDRRDP